MRTDTVYAEPYPQEVRAAIYCRLSKDDDLSGPSASIQNQRELLCRYCEEQGWRVAGIFQDDGYTGLNMERPDFQKMLAAVERKMFDVVLTKEDCVIIELNQKALENRDFVMWFCFFDPKTDTFYTLLAQGGGARRVERPQQHS